MLVDRQPLGDLRSHSARSTVGSVEPFLDGWTITGILY
jgi:hypothetical protein